MDNRDWEWGKWRNIGQTDFQLCGKFWGSHAQHVQHSQQNRTILLKAAVTVGLKCSYHSNNKNHEMVIT